LFKQPFKHLQHTQKRQFVDDKTDKTKMKKKVKKLKKNSLVKVPLKALDTVRGRIATAVSAAFAFVIALSWNDAIKSLIEYWFPVNQGSVTAKFVYALLVTAILVVVTMYLVRLFKDKKE